MSKNRRGLQPIPLADVFGHGVVITMGVGQWDATLERAYQMGWTLLELDDNERPVRAYRSERRNWAPEDHDPQSR